MKAWFPFYVGDFIVDTMKLTDAQIGAYVRLLCYLWRNGGTVKRDNLSRILGTRSDRLNWVIDLLSTDDGGATFHQKRLTEELARAEGISSIKRSAGIKGNLMRWGESGVAYGIAHATDDLSHMGSHNDRQSQSQSQPTKDKDSVLNQKDDSIRGESFELDSTTNGESPAPKPNGSVPFCPYESLAAMYHVELPQLPAITVLSPARKRTMQARWREVVTADHLDRDAGIEFFREFFRHIGASAFLTGKTAPKKPGDRTFKADFDWILNPDNFVKIVEGRYHQTRGKP